MSNDSDGGLARRLASEAGALLVRLRESPQWQAADPSTRKDEGDRAAHRYLAAELAAACPGDAVLSEEAADDTGRLTADRVWIIDPLDGTREFAEERFDWAVHVALWSGGTLVAGAVALPARGITLATDEAPSAPAAASRRRRIAVSRSRAPAVVEDVARELDAELVPLGSAGFKAASVVLGEVDAYVHAGGQHEWDSAAPVAVARAAKLHASRLDGAPLAYNRPVPYLPDLVVCRAELAATLLAACRPTTWSAS